MLKIKLKPMGRTGIKTYRIVIQEEHSKLTGAYMDQIGVYDKSVRPPKLSFDKNLLDSWLKKGAQMTQKVRSLLTV